MTDVPRIQIVQSMYERLSNGDVAGARAMWADDAVWHLTGSHEFAGDYDPDGYLQVLGRWQAQFPSYQADFKELRDLGEDGAMIFMESSGGMAPGTASGVLVYRVVDGRIAEGWAIPTSGGGRYAF
jgi:ketosteroid isomerase-like protein